MVSMMTRRRSLLAAAALLTAGRASAQNLRDISLALASRSMVSTVPLVAKELGLFEKHGLSPKFVIMDSANAATAALISRSVEVAMSGSAEVVAAQAHGLKVVMIASAYSGLSGSLVLGKSVAEKTGVAPTGPVRDRLKALDGLVLASTSATSSFTISYGSAAKAEGATVRFTYMALSAMMAALESGAVQGFIATAPYWAFPVLKGTGVLWISAPRGELPSEYTPVSPANLQVMRDFAEANPGVVASLAAIVAEFVKAVDERPDEVKGAIAKIFPDLDRPTIDLLFGVESNAWKVKPLTPVDMAHEIAYVKLSGMQLPQIDKVDPASLLFP
jgi:ABC-type nitrate/sulfonate/bicarbonate transport system substrate-binding protein